MAAITTLVVAAKAAAVSATATMVTLVVAATATMVTLAIAASVAI